MILLNQRNRLINTFIFWLQLFAMQNVNINHRISPLNFEFSIISIIHDSTVERLCSRRKLNCEGNHLGSRSWISPWFRKNAMGANVVRDMSNSEPSPLCLCRKCPYWLIFARLGDFLVLIDVGVCLPSIFRRPFLLMKMSGK